jgi:hypothetical protein
MCKCTERAGSALPLATLTAGALSSDDSSEDSSEDSSLGSLGGGGGGLAAFPNFCLLL